MADETDQEYRDRLSRFRGGIAKQMSTQRRGPQTKGKDTKAGGVDRAALWSKAMKSGAPAAPPATGAEALGGVRATVAAPVRKDSIDRKALWAKAMREAKHLPLLDFEPDDF